MSCGLNRKVYGSSGAFVGEGDLDALVQERELAQATGKNVEVIFVHGEDGFVRQKVDLGAAPAADAYPAQFADGVTLAVVLLPGSAVAPDLHIELFAERIDAADAHAVQTAGHLVAAGVELAARVQLGQHHLHRGHLLAVAQVLHVHGNAAAVVDNGDRVIDTWMMQSMRVAWPASASSTELSTTSYTR